MSFTQKVHIKGSPQQVFEAITQHVQKWWGYTDLPVHKVGDAFTTRFKQSYWKFSISSFKPYQELVWTCIEARHIHQGYENIEQEWVNTSVEWKLEATGENETLLHFTHQGLVPELNCYEICYPAWEWFVSKSLKSLVETGTGMPHLA